MNLIDLIGDGGYATFSVRDCQGLSARRRETRSCRSEGGKDGRMQPCVARCGLLQFCSCLGEVEFGDCVGVVSWVRMHVAFVKCRWLELVMVSFCRPF